MRDSRFLVAGATLLALLTATACSGGGDEPGGEPGRPDAVAEWSDVKLPDQKLRRGNAVELETALSPGPGGPYLVVGTTTRPGSASTVTAFTTTDGKRFAPPVALDVPGDPAVAGAVASGRRTLAFGSTWEKGRSTSWIRGTTDRKSWTEVDVPAGLLEGGAVLSDVLPLEGEDALVLGVGDEHQLLAQHLTDGDVETLPAAPDKARYDGIQASARKGDTLVVVASAEKSDATDVLVALTSSDAGKTWAVQAGPGGDSPVVRGVAVVGNEFVATGWTGAAESKPAAWAGKDGKTWEPDQLAGFSSAEGWPVWMGQPRVHEGRVYASMNYQQYLSGQVVVRVAGKWNVVGPYDNASSPGVEAVIAPGLRGAVIARSDLGRATLGLLTRGYTTARKLGTSEFTGYWDAPTTDSAAPALSYSHTVVDVKDNFWTRKTATEQLRFEDAGTVAVTGIEPPQARRLANPSSASAPDGSTVLMGEDTHVDDAPGKHDDTDVAGFFRAKDGKWQPVTGLAGPRTEQLGKVAKLGDLWVATGSDRLGFEGAAHQFGAVWTSSDGLAWKRATGSFDASPQLDSWVSDACLSPSGTPMVVGGTEDQSRGSVPKAWQLTSGTWEPLELSGLGEGITAVSGCVGTGKVTLLRGDAVTGSKVWRTSDLEKFEKVTIAGEDNSFGTLRQVSGGFAATGFLGEGTKSQSVLWLSRNGEDWTSVEIPSDRQVGASDVVQWGKRLVVLMDGDGGPAVASLDNFDKVLAAVK